MLTPPETSQVTNTFASGSISPNGKQHTIAIASPKYTEENEIQTKTIVNMTESNGLHTSDSTATDNANDAQEFGKLGSLVFKLRYLADRNALVVSVIRCRGLPNKIHNNDDLPGGINGKTQTATDPYIKLQLLPEKQHKVKTRYVQV